MPDFISVIESPKPSSSSSTLIRLNPKLPREASTTVKIAYINDSNLFDSDTKLMFPTSAKPRQMMQ